MRRRQHRAEDAPQPRPRTGSAPPIRREIDPVLGQRRSQRRCRALVAAEPVASQAGRAAVHTVDASWRRPAPSQTQPPPPARHCDRRPTRPDTPAARSSRCRAPPAKLTTDSRPGGCRRSSHPEGRTRRLARAGLAAYSVREAGFPSTSSLEAKSQNGDSLVQRSGSLSLAAAPPPLHGSELTRARARRANSSRARTSTRVTLLGLRRHAAAAARRGGFARRSAFGGSRSCRRSWPRSRPGAPNWRRRYRRVSRASRTLPSSRSSSATSSERYVTVPCRNGKL